MRRIIALLGAAALLAALAFPAQAARGTEACYVEPNPVPINTSYTVYSTGLDAALRYDLHVTQPGQSAEITKIDLVLIPDANGNAQQTLDWSGPRGIWNVGKVNVAIGILKDSKWTQFTKVASCSFYVS